MVESLFRIAGLGGIALAIVLSGCARPTGDFGRAEIDPLHDAAMPNVGVARATAAAEPVSSFDLTDEEREMRDRVWHYLVSPHASSWFRDTVVELQRTRIVPTTDKGMRPQRYYEWLSGERYASAQVRYVRIADDVTTDLAMMPSAFAAVCTVVGIDRQRGIAGDRIEGLEESMKHEAKNRLEENSRFIGWFVAGVLYRYQSYSYGLDHLLVETPHKEAVTVNGLLSDLDVYVEAAERGDFCDPASASTDDGGDATLVSRYQRPRMPSGPLAGS